MISDQITQTAWSSQALPFQLSRQGPGLERCILVDILLLSQSTFCSSSEAQGPLYAHSITHSISSVANPLLLSWEALQPSTGHSETVTVFKSIEDIMN